MSARVTLNDLEAVVRRINRTVNGVDTLDAWTRTNGSYQQIPGMYHLSGAYGGYALYRNCDIDATGESHGVTDVLACGHMPKRELYERMQAFLRGIEAVSSR